MGVFRIPKPSPALCAAQEAILTYLDFRAATADLSSSISDMQECIEASDAAIGRFARTSALEFSEAESQIKELGDHLWDLHKLALKLLANTCLCPQDAERDVIINECREIWAEVLGVGPEETDHKIAQDHVASCDICSLSFS